jgi:hypothetical protein
MSQMSSLGIIALILIDGDETILVRIVLQTGRLCVWKGLACKLGNCICLRVPDLEQYRALIRQVLWGRLQQCLNGVQARFAGEQGSTGLIVPDVARERGVLCFTDVGQIGDNEVHWLCHWGEQVSVQELDPIGDAGSLCVGTGHVERRRRDVGGKDRGTRELARQGNGDGPASCAYVDNPCDGAAVGDVNREFYEQFCLGTRDQDAWIHVQVKVKKGPMPNEIGHRFVLGSPRDEFFKCLALCRAKYLLRMGEQRGRLTAKNVAQQHVGGDLRLARSH